VVEDAQALLAEALRHARVTRFEVTEPTLEEIFIEKVRETSPKEQISLSAGSEEEELEGSYLNA
jgi:ABC-2 type transport system ATP-binding protein